MSTQCASVACSALVLGVAWWPVRGWSVRSRTILLIVAVSLLFVLPWLVANQTVGQRAIVSLFCCALLPPKLLDAHLAPEVWRDRPFPEWLVYLINPFVLCYRRHLRDRGRPRRRDAALVVRGLAEMAVGATVSGWAFRMNDVQTPLLIEHTAKLLGVYLLVFDGAFVLANGALGLLGGRYLDFCRHPILARTPADFWRRYNRDAGRFLYEDVYTRITPGRSVRALLLVFVLNGALHEYLAWVILHRLTGLLMAFFVIQGLATVATSRFRPRGWRARTGMLATLSFNLLTSVLFLAGAGFYPERMCRCFG